MMSKLATLAFGAALAISPALVFAQSSSNPSGTPSSSATTNGVNNNGMINGQPAGSSKIGTTGRSLMHRRHIGTANRSMPRTSAGWLAMLLSGSSISGAGLALRRLRKA